SVDHARAGRARYSKIDVRALIDEGKSIFLAGSRIGECSGVALQHFNVRLGHLCAVVVADKEPMDDRYVLAADETDTPGLVHLGGDNADQKRALPILGNARDNIGSDWIGADVDQPEFLLWERRRDGLHGLDHVEGRSNDDVEALSGGARQCRLKL